MLSNPAFIFLHLPNWKQFKNSFYKLSNKQFLDREIYFCLIYLFVIIYDQENKKYNPPHIKMINSKKEKSLTQAANFRW